MVIQVPIAYEFNQELLVFLADHVNSCLFGNFLGNSDKQRRTELLAPDETKSIWGYVIDHKQQFCNTGYTAVEHPVWPTFSICRLEVWARLHLRWDRNAHRSGLLGDASQWHDDW